MNWEINWRRSHCFGYKDVNFCCKSVGINSLLEADSFFSQHQSYQEKVQDIQ